jgi:hypothetical protein
VLCLTTNVTTDFRATIFHQDYQCSFVAMVMQMHQKCSALQTFLICSVSDLHYYARNNITYMYPVQVSPLRANTIRCYLKQDTAEYFNLYSCYSLVTPSAVLGVTVLFEKKGADVRMRDSLKMSFTVSHLIIMIQVQFLSTLLHKGKRYSSPITGLEWPRWFQEVKVPRLHDNGTGWW